MLMFRASFFLYLLALVIAPLAFGTVETWSLTFMETTGFAALLLHLLSRYFEQESSFRKTPGLLFILLLPGFFLLQLLPMPAAVIKFVSPAAYELYDKTIGLVQPLGWLSITLNKKATLSEFFRFTAYAAIFFLTIQFTARRQRLMATTYLLIFTGAIIAFLAIVQKVTAGGLIYWFRASPSATPMGPYVYRNQFAGYVEMIFPLTLALFLWTKPAAGELLSRRGKFIEFFNNPGVNTHTLLGVSATILATSVFFSLSRGGIISLSLALLCMFLILNRRKQLSGQGLFFIMVPLVTLIFVGWFGWAPIIARFQTLQTADGIYDARFKIWQDVIPMVRDFWLTGSGAGSFETTFPAYQFMRFGDRIIDHAHNDYLELWGTTGLVGMLLVGSFLVRIVRESTRIIARRKDSLAVYLWGASLTGMISIFLHSGTDFNFYNGANGLYFFTLCGLLVGGAAATTRPGVRSWLSDYPVSRRQLLVVIIGVAVLLVGGLAINVRAMLAVQHFNKVRDIALNRNIPRAKLLAMKTWADRAVQLDPLAARNFYLQANIASFLRDSVAAATAYRRAIGLQPLKGEYLQQYGFFAATVSRGSEPESLLRAATLVNPGDPEVHLRYGNWLLDKEEPARGFTQLKTGLTMNPGRLTGQLALLVVAGFKGAELQAILPDGIRYQLSLALFLERLGRFEEATEVFRQVEARLNSTEATEGDYQKIISYYTRQQLDEAALRVNRQLVGRFPTVSRYQIMLGDLLARNGLGGGAEEAFRRAVSLAPTELFPLLKLASFLVAQGRTEEAEQEYRRAVELLAKATDFQPGKLWPIYNYYYRQGEYDQALAVINRGLKAQPGNLAIRIILGDAYLQMGRRLDARVEYQRVMARDPDNSAARQRLEKMGVTR
jgi:tetratricopeptide (TPR) repeat protein/O-antigen ligase